MRQKTVSGMDPATVLTGTILSQAQELRISRSLSVNSCQQTVPNVL